MPPCEIERKLARAVISMPRTGRDQDAKGYKYSREREEENGRGRRIGDSLFIGPGPHRPPGVAPCPRACVF